MELSYEKPEVKLTGEDGNAFYILGKVIKEMERAGATKDEIKRYKEEAMSGDYNNLLTVTMEFVDVF